MGSKSARTLELPYEVQEVVMICTLGLLAYFVMVCCILCRRPPELASELNIDVRPESFIRRHPEDYDGYFHTSSDIETIRGAVSTERGRIMIDRGEATFRSGSNVTCRLTRSIYATFGPEEAFDIVDRSEDLMFHLELYSEFITLDEQRKEAVKVD